MTDLTVDEFENLIRKVVYEKRISESSPQFVPIKEVMKMLSIKSKLTAIRRLSDYGIERRVFGKLVRYNKAEIEKVINSKL